MLRTQPASKRPSAAAVWSLACVTSLAIFHPSAFRIQTPQKSTTLDLTAKPPTGERGYPGIPGAEMGGFSGPGPGRATSTYSLPLQVQILNSLVDSERNFVIEVAVRNVGDTVFELPSSRNLTKIEAPGNKSQRLFFFMLRPSGRNQTDQLLRSIPVGGSSSVPGSFKRLGPGETLRVLLPVSGEEVRRAFKDGIKELDVRIVCSEWQLEDDRYFIRGRSADLASSNTIKFVLRDGDPVALQP